jgi:hypothetical protein
VASVGHLGGRPTFLVLAAHHDLDASSGIRVVALDLPTSWMMATANRDEFTGRMFEAINSMLLDMLAAVARKDYDDRRRRQAQGQAKAKAEGRYKGPQRIQSAMLRSAARWTPSSLGARYRPLRAAAARPLPRSPSAPSRPPEARQGAMGIFPPTVDSGEDATRRRDFVLNAN